VKTHNIADYMLPDQQPQGHRSDTLPISGIFPFVLNDYGFVGAASAAISLYAAKARSCKMFSSEDCFALSLLTYALSMEGSRAE